VVRMGRRMSYSASRLEEILGRGGGSPEVKPNVKKAFQLLFAGTVGHRISKYGTTYGLIPLFTALGEATKSPAIKDYASLLGQGVAGTISLLGVLFLPEKWTRALAWGGLFQTVEAGLDAVEAMILAR